MKVLICKLEDILGLAGDANPANIYLFKVNNRNTRKRCSVSNVGFEQVNVTWEHNIVSLLLYGDLIFTKGKRRITHIDFRTNCVIMMQRTRPPSPPRPLLFA